MKIKEKHIERLAAGKKSGIHIGSRGIPHHLYQYEQKKFTIAIKNKFLSINYRYRENLLNIWKKYCESRNWPYFVLVRQADGSALVHTKHQIQIFVHPSEAKQFIVTQI